MLTKQNCYFDDKKEAVKWIEVPIEKEDIIAYLEKRIKYIECDFLYCKKCNFFDEIEFLRHAVLAFSDAGILTYSEVEKYLQKYEEFFDRYMELKKL